MDSMAYFIGVLVGMLCGVALVAVLFWFLKKKFHVDVREYDERQILARGIAYKYAFYTLAVLILLEKLVEQVGVVLFDSLEGAAAMIMVGLLVFIVVCVRRDAYMTLHETPKMVLVLLTVAGGLNLAIAAAGLLHGEHIVTDGRLGSGSLNLLVGLFVAVILVVFLINQWSVRRAEREE